MHHGENSTREGSETKVSPSFVDNLRSSVAGRALGLLLLVAACGSGRTGKYQIEIAGDPQATVILEDLRKKFKTASQSPYRNEEEVQAILAERRRLLEDFNIPGDTELWWNTDHGNGPTIEIEVDEDACARAARCRLKRIAEK